MPSIKEKIRRVFSTKQKLLVKSSIICIDAAFFKICANHFENCRSFSNRQELLKFAQSFDNNTTSIKNSISECFNDILPESVLRCIKNLDYSGKYSEYKNPNSQNWIDFYLSLFAAANLKEKDFKETFEQQYSKTSNMMLFIKNEKMASLFEELSYGSGYKFRILAANTPQQKSAMMNGYKEKKNKKKNKF
jgi:hypothetical protein